MSDLTLENAANAAARQTTLAAAIANSLGAWRRCQLPTANASQREWGPRHLERAESLVREHMPSGSGIDCGTKIDLDRSTDSQLVFIVEFHHMDSDGFYCGWTTHRVTVRPAFDGVDISISGRNHNDIKDYLADVYHAAVTAKGAWL